MRIFTPDLSKDMVEAILITMYTGQTVLSWNLLEKINIGFKTIGMIYLNIEFIDVALFERDIICHKKT